jgi:hypothetical protein
VSTADQNPDHQIDAFTRAGVDARNIYVDVASGAKAPARSGISSASSCAMATR